MEVFTLIARKKNVALVFVSYLLVALAAISLLTICIGFAPGILFAVVFGLIAYLMIMAQNTEFEYSYAMQIDTDLKCFVMADNSNIPIKRELTVKARKALERYFFEHTRSLL